MKAIILFSISLFLFTPEAKSQELSTDVLIGSWKLDMSPQDPSDNNFAMMEIKDVKKGEMKGTFYREGVKLREGKLNTKTGVIYGALVSGDNSGEYNTSFYYKDGKLYGTTHAIDRGFLAVWVATKE